LSAACKARCRTAGRPLRIRSYSRITRAVGLPSRGHQDTCSQTTSQHALLTLPGDRQLSAGIAVEVTRGGRRFTPLSVPTAIVNRHLRPTRASVCASLAFHCETRSPARSGLSALYPRPPTTALAAPPCAHFHPRTLTELRCTFCFRAGQKLTRQTVLELT
jgi:hypothetical protein